MKINRFEDLTIWRDSITLTKRIYDITSSGKFSTDFGLRDQIRRAIVSISSNIVEGFEKNNNNEFIRFLRIAKGSLGEVRNQLYIAVEINYISRDLFEELDVQLLDLSNQIGKFITYLENLRKQGQFQHANKQLVNK